MTVSNIKVDDLYQFITQKMPNSSHLQLQSVNDYCPVEMINCSKELNIHLFHKYYNILLFIKI